MARLALTAAVAAAGAQLAAASYFETCYFSLMDDDGSRLARWNLTSEEKEQKVPVAKVPLVCTCAQARCWLCARQHKAVVAADRPMRSRDPAPRPQRDT